MTDNEAILMYVLNNGPKALEKIEKFAHELSTMVPKEMYLACVCMLIDYGVEKYDYDPIEVAEDILNSVKEVNTKLGGMFPC